MSIGKPDPMTSRFFKDFRAITENPELALEGLQKGIPLVVKRIAEDLIRQ